MVVHRWSVGSFVLSGVLLALYRRHTRTDSSRIGGEFPESRHAIGSRRIPSFRYTQATAGLIAQ